MNTREALLDVAWLIVLLIMLPLAIPLGILAVAILFLQRTVLWRRAAT